MDTVHAEPATFYVDERRAARPGLRLTDHLLELAGSPESTSLAAKAEARWQLVERAWEPRGTGWTSGS